jgi:hypothetical protein
MQAGGPTLLELSTVRLELQEFVHMCALQRGEVIQLYTDNQVTMHVINSMVSRSSTLMAELRLSTTCCKSTASSRDAVHPLSAEPLADRLTR